MIIGCDIDGVLADFNTSFIQRVINVTGRDLFPVRPFDIPCWNYPQHYGYSEAEVSSVWESIKADGMFWEQLPAYEGTAAAIQTLEERRRVHGDDIYFVTARPGIAAKGQTERWLMSHGVYHPTVIISNQKGNVCEALKIEAYIDDRWENALDVAIKPAPYSPPCLQQPVWASSSTKSYLMVRPWNKGNDSGRYGITEIVSVADAFTRYSAGRDFGDENPS